MKRWPPTLVLVAVLGSAVYAVSASAITINGCDTGEPFSWTGNGDGISWSDPDNWTPVNHAPPKANDTATISVTGATVDASGSSVCNLTLSGQIVSLETGGTFMVGGNLTWEGGQGPDQEPSTIAGSITVAGSADLTGRDDPLRSVEMVPCVHADDRVKAVKDKKPG